MDYDAIAKRCVDDMFDQAEADGRVMHRDAMTKRIADVLRKEMPAAPTQPWAYGGLCFQFRTPTVEPTEWR